MFRLPCCILSILLLFPLALHASDHLDAPALTDTSMGSQGQSDLSDLYAFQSPVDSDNSVLILTVNPFAGNLSPTDFATDVAYEFQIDNTGDGAADLTYQATFSGSGASQAVALTRNGVAEGAGAAGVPFSTVGGGNVLAGLFDDPFFFDLAGFGDGFNFDGTDAFAGANVSAIVLEVPSSELGGPNIGVQARTVKDGAQVDRVGRPAINTVLIPSDRKDEFNASSPENDAVFAEAVQMAIEGLGNSANAESLAGILLPDLLTFDTSSSAGFLNGRQLADDVIDAELNLLSGGGVTTDGVDENVEGFRTVFPYLQVANAVPEPTSIVPSVIGLLGLAGRRRRQG